MRLTVEHAQLEYARLNALYFSSALPDIDIDIVADPRSVDGPRCRLLGMVWKDADGFKVQLRSGQTYDRWLLTLAHEAVHIKLWPQRSHRSKAWKDEVARLGRAGLLAEAF